MKKTLLDIQIGGDHYKGMKVQPAEIFDSIPMPGMAMMALKYVARWRKKGGMEDLHKAQHCLAMQIEFDAPRWKKLGEFRAQFPELEAQILHAIATGKYTRAIAQISDLIKKQISDDHEPTKPAND